MQLSAQIAVESLEIVFSSLLAPLRIDKVYFNKKSAGKEMISFNIFNLNFDKNKKRRKNNREGSENMSKSKSQEVREWTVRKKDQNPKGKIKSFKHLSKEAEQGK